MTTLSAFDPVFLLSLFKPLVILLTYMGWGFVASKFDKDAGYYFLKRNLFNLAQMACAAVGLLMLLFIPIFWVGYPLAVLVMIGGLFGYVQYRNKEVPPKEKWTFNLDGIRKMMGERQQARADKAAVLKFLAKDEAELPVPAHDDPYHAAHEAIETLLVWAFPRRTEEITLAVDANEAKLAARIDGVKYGQKAMGFEEALEPQTGVQMIKYLQDRCGLDTEEQRKKQTGTCKVDAGEAGRHTLEVTTSGSSRSRNFSLQIDPQAKAGRPFNLLGLTKTQQEQLRKVIETPGKVVLVCSPPKSGLSTTIYSLVNEHDPYMSSVQTLEDEIEIDLEGVKHNLVADGAGPEQFNKQLAGLLRTDPQVVLLSRLADRDTAQLIARQSEECRVYLPVKAKNTFEAVDWWVRAVGDRKLAASALGAVVCQRLVRTLCDTCKTAYTPDPSAIKKMNLPAEKVGELYRASGQVLVKDKPQVCPNCHGIGYVGRLGVFEVMVVDPNAAQLIAQDNADGLRAHLRKNKMAWLQEAGLGKVVEGITDIKEVTRVMSDGKKKPAPTKK